MSNPVAVVDCGTNTLRLLVTDGREIRREQRIVRLGQGVDATGRFAPAAIDRALRVVGEYADLMHADGVTRVRFVATSAARDVDNADDFFRRVRGLLPTAAIDIISGADEARYSFAGATAEHQVTDPTLVVDIGGGSTELVRRDAAGLRRVSLDIGAVRLRERVLRSDPPTDAEIAQGREWVRRELDGSPVDLTGVQTWIGVAGTATTLAALDLGLATYDRSRVDQHTVTPDAVMHLARELLAAPVTDILAIPVMEAGRAEVIASGALICAAIAERVGRPMIVSEADILDGVAAELLAERLA